MKDLQDFSQTVDLTETFKFVEENFSYDPGASTDDTGSYNAIDSSSDYHSAWMHSQSPQSQYQSQSQDKKESVEDKERRDREERRKSEAQGIGIAPSISVHQDA